MTDCMTLRVTKKEAEMIMDALHIVATAGGDRRGHDIAELNELHDDLFEQVARPDEWTADLEPTEIAEDAFVQAGIDARHQQKASSRAASRRNMRFGEFQVQDTERVTAPPANDPVDW